MKRTLEDNGRPGACFFCDRDLPMAKPGLHKCPCGHAWRISHVVQLVATPTRDAEQLECLPPVTF
jgi:hypothetical protein